MNLRNLLTFLITLGFSINGMAEDQLTATKVAGQGPMLDVADKIWETIPAVTVPMLPQNVVLPFNVKPAVSELKVKTAHNGQWLGVLLEWADPQENDWSLTDQYGDQVAIQLPLEKSASPMMGNPKGRVNVLQWRAALQRDLDQGNMTLKDLYPNALVDLYPDKILRASDAKPYSGALGLGNPVSHQDSSPVLDQIAEGWGTLTVKLEQQGNGRGAWKEGTWRVIITLPLSGGGINSPNLAPDQATEMAFAVWEGGAKEVGSRKAWSNWVPLKLAP